MQRGMEHAEQLQYNIIIILSIVHMWLMSLGMHCASNFSENIKWKSAEKSAENAIGSGMGSHGKAKKYVRLNCHLGWRMLIIICTHCYKVYWSRIALEMMNDGMILRIYTYIHQRPFRVTVLIEHIRFSRLTVFYVKFRDLDCILSDWILVYPRKIYHGN